MIPDEIISQIRERTDIVALVGEYVPLKRAGSSFKGLCPFHSEKTPSFQVNPARQFFHCFGCQVSGDVIKFVMQLEGRTFPEAARALAERAGIEIPVTDVREDAESKRRKQHFDRLYAVMDAAAGFYVRMLHEHPLGKLAREEIARRGVSPEVAETFRLGYAPHGWDHLARFLREHDFRPAEAEEAGLVLPRKSGDGFYDRFRHRLMFAIADPHGKIVAFSGRVLPPPPGEPPKEEGEAGAKYVNSPEGPLYKKGEILYGLHEGRVAIRREGWALVCEGNFDRVCLHQGGFENAVAPMGTAFTPQQAKLLRRYADRVVLIFDGDKAGRKATRAAFPLLQAAGLAARVVRLPQGEDPDTFIRNRGADQLRSLIANAPGIVEHLIDDAAREAAGDAQAKAAAIAALGPVLKTVENPVERRVYVERTAQRFGIHDLRAVREQLQKGVREGAEPAPRRGTDRGQSAGSGPRPEPPRRVELPRDEADIVGAFLDVPALFGEPEFENVQSLLTSSDLQAIFHAAARLGRERGTLDVAALLAEVGDSAARGWLEERLSIENFDEREARAMLQRALPLLRKQEAERQLPRLAELAMEARRAGDHDRADELTRERDQLAKSIGVKR